MKMKIQLVGLINQEVLAELNANRNKNDTYAKTMDISVNTKVCFSETDKNRCVRNLEKITKPGDTIITSTSYAFITDIMQMLGIGDDSEEDER